MEYHVNNKYGFFESQRDCHNARVEMKNLLQLNLWKAKYVIIVYVKNL